MKIIVNIISNIRVESEYVHSYVQQLLCLKQEVFEIGKIVLVCDDVLRLSRVKDWAKIDQRVILIQENASDLNLKSLEEKTLQWADLSNQGVTEALNFESNYILFIEADLTFPFDFLDELVKSKLDISAPVVFLGSGFYDSWGFRDLRGEKITNIQNLAVYSEPLELSSVGSCVLFKTDIFKNGIRFRGPYDTGLLVGVCNDARALGYKVWMLPHLSIIHPTSTWRKQVWWITDMSFNHSSINAKIECRQMVAGAYEEIIDEEIKKCLNNSKNINPIKYKFTFEKNFAERTLSVIITDP